MPEPETIAAIAAACETIAPATDGIPGAKELGVHRHIVDMVEKSLPGMVDMVAVLLNAFASEVRAGAGFVELSPGERSTVLRLMSADDSQDIRDAVDALLVFTYGGVFSEWTGYDRATRDLRAPKSWAAVGFHGPVHGHPNYREDV